MPTIVKNGDIDISISNAIQNYADAYWNLRSLIDKHLDYLPRGLLSCCLIAEFYTKIYLEGIYPNSGVIYGSANEAGWDIVVRGNGQDIKYQVKSISTFSKSRGISNIKRGFDKLIIIALDGNFFPSEVLLFEDANQFWSYGYRTLTFPANLAKPRNNLFKIALNIKEEFLMQLE